MKRRSNVSACRILAYDYKIEIELWFRLEYNSNQLKEREGEDKTQDRELLQMILTTVLDVQSDVKELQEEMKEVKADIRDMKVDIQDTKDDVRGLREEAVDLRSSIKSIETTLENEIAHGIKIIAMKLILICIENSTRH